MVYSVEYTLLFTSIHTEDNKLNELLNHVFQN